MFVIPKTKQMESKMLDFPLPLRPVMELKLSSLCGDCQQLHPCIAAVSDVVCGGVYHPEITVRTAYDLKPCDTVSHDLIMEQQGSTYVYYDLCDPHVGGLRSVVVVDLRIEKSDFGGVTRL